MNIFIWYEKCSTCKKAKKYLDEKKQEYILRDIKQENPSYQELEKWVNEYNIEVKKLFNTSGILYREMNLATKLNSMTESEKIKLLSTNGMLVKRPLFITKDKIYIGFKEQEWKNI